MSNAPDAKAVARMAQAPLEPAPAVSTATSVLQIIERVATDPNADVDKMERLLAMQERILAQQAKAAYTAAMIEMKPKLPVVDRKGRIEVREKDASGKRTGELQQSTAYAKWEDIDEAITPILHEHGFSLTFRSGTAPDGKVTVTAVLSHVASDAVIGHTEETTITLPHDSTGSKNPAQAVVSSTSYGKRIAATLLLNIRTRGEDDDGESSHPPATITEAEAKAFHKLCDDLDGDEAKFCKFVGAASVEAMTPAQLKKATTTLNTWAKGQREKQTVNA